MGTQEGIELSKHGGIINPNLHDADLIGIFISEKDCILILARDVTGTVFCVAFTGVEAFHGEDLREGNIIFDIAVQTATSVSREDIVDLYRLAHDPNATAVFEGIAKRISENELMLVRLNPSLGCEFVCTCTGISLVDDWAAKIAQLSK